MRKISLLVCLFLIFGVEIIESTPPMKESNLLTIRIDQYNRIWWNLKTVTMDNLPKLISNRINDILPQNDNSVYLKLTRLLKNHIASNDRLVILILAHPESHYVILDNLLFIKNTLELEKNKEIAIKKNCDIDSLAIYDKYKFRYGIQKWRERDNKIIEAACDEEYIVSDGLKICDEEFQFETKHEQGYWDDKIRDGVIYNFIQVKAPKVGIPVPLRDGD